MSLLCFQLTERLHVVAASESDATGEVAIARLMAGPQTVLRVSAATLDEALTRLENSMLELAQIIREAAEKERETSTRANVKRMACESCGESRLCTPPQGDLNGAWSCAQCKVDA